MSFNVYSKGVYYYRIVQERCYDRFERTLDVGVYPSICVDLVQLGLVRLKNTRNPGFAKICGEGMTLHLTEKYRTLCLGTMRDTSYGELEPYCENYKTPYAMMICALAGAGLIMIGEIVFSIFILQRF